LDAFLAALRHEVVDAAGTVGLFELTEVASLEHLKATTKVIDTGVQELLESAHHTAKQRRTRPPTYRATVAELVRRTPTLLDREGEVNDLLAYASGRDGYRWVIGGPWAGKTALIAHLTTRLGPNVDWVAYLEIGTKCGSHEFGDQS